MKKNILFFILGLIVMGEIGATAYSYTAKQVSFTPNDKSWRVKTVEEALTDLRENGTENKFCEIKSGSVLEVGSMYECDPGDETKRNFYVLDVRESSVDLIMDRNINSGGMSWNNAMNYFKSGEGNAIYNNWKNILKIDLPSAQQIAYAVEYYDWNNLSTDFWCFETKTHNASPPWCNNVGTYYWLYANTSNDTDNADYAWGYWTRDKAFNKALFFAVGGDGTLSIDNSENYGVRPVITISKSNIK